jgi:hypothetical protein
MNDPMRLSFVIANENFADKHASRNFNLIALDDVLFLQTLNNGYHHFSGHVRHPRDIRTKRRSDDKDFSNMANRTTKTNQTEANEPHQDLMANREMEDQTPSKESVKGAVRTPLIDYLLHDMVDDCLYAFSDDSDFSESEEAMAFLINSSYSIVLDSSSLLLLLIKIFRFINYYDSHIHTESGSEELLSG